VLADWRARLSSLGERSAGHGEIRSGIFSAIRKVLHGYGRQKLRSGRLSLLDCIQ